MGRLIDADEVDDAIYKSFEDIQCYDGSGYDIYSDSKEIIDKILTVEAIPKDQYEARLKADMVAMLTEILLEIEQCGVEDSHWIIKEKIDKLKENKDDK